MEEHKLGTVSRASGLQNASNNNFDCCSVCEVAELMVVRERKERGLKFWVVVNFLFNLFSLCHYEQLVWSSSFALPFCFGENVIK